MKDSNTYGFYLPDCYMGNVDGKFMKFPTELEYLEYLQEDHITCRRRLITILKKQLNL